MISILKKIVKCLGGKQSRIDAHASLFRLGRDEYKYCENGRCLILQIEMLRGDIQRSIYASTIKRWLPPHENEAISVTDRNRIAEKIRVYFEKNGMASVIEN
jgi:hypothetical protein